MVHESKFTKLKLDMRFVNGSLPPAGAGRTRVSRGYTSREYVLDRGRALNVEYAAQSLLTLLRQQLAGL